MLEAAQRAEADGRLDMAVQFYRHLAEQYPPTREAALARDALGRISRLGQNLGAQPLSAQPLSAQKPGPQRPQQPPARQPQHAAQPVIAQPVTGHTGAAPRRGISFAPIGGEHAHDFEPPPPRADYRTGRFLARLTTWLGGAAACAGLVVLPVALLGPRLIGHFGVANDALAMLPPAIGVSVALALVGVGLVMMMAGQLVRAVLDQANASRDLAALARARAEHDGADQRTGRNGHHGRH